MIATLVILALSALFFVNGKIRSDQGRTLCTRAPYGL